MATLRHDHERQILRTVDATFGHRAEVAVLTIFAAAPRFNLITDAELYTGYRALLDIEPHLDEDEPALACLRATLATLEVEIGEREDEDDLQGYYDSRGHWTC